MKYYYVSNETTGEKTLVSDWQLSDWFRFNFDEEQKKEGTDYFSWLADMKKADLIKEVNQIEEISTDYKTIAKKLLSGDLYDTGREFNPEDLERCFGILADWQFAVDLDYYSNIRRN